MWGEATQNTEFTSNKDTPILDNIPCALDTLLAGSRMATAAPGSMTRQIAGVLFISDTRLGMLPNRNFNEENWFVIDGLPYSIAEIHEARNRLTGELDHYEIYVYRGVNR